MFLSIQVFVCWLIKVPYLGDEPAGGTGEFFYLEADLYNIVDVSDDVVEILEVKHIDLKLAVADLENDFPRFFVEDSAMWKVYFGLVGLHLFPSLLPLALSQVGVVGTGA
jgi:hypothetical protein